QAVGACLLSMLYADNTQYPTNPDLIRNIRSIPAAQRKNLNRMILTTTLPSILNSPDRPPNSLPCLLLLHPHFQQLLVRRMHMSDMCLDGQIRLPFVGFRRRAAYTP